MLYNRQKRAKYHHLLGNRCKGDAQLLFGGRIIPSSSICANSALATLNFSGTSRRGQLWTRVENCKFGSWCLLESDWLFWSCAVNPRPYNYISETLFFSRYFLVDSAAQISMIPATEANKKKGPHKFTLLALIKTNGQRYLTLHLDLRRELSSIFLWLLTWRKPYRVQIFDTNMASSWILTGIAWWTLWRTLSRLVGA